jgi:hypothetical protein
MEFGKNVHIGKLFRSVSGIVHILLLEPSILVVDNALHNNETQIDPRIQAHRLSTTLPVSTNQRYDIWLLLFNLGKELFLLPQL